MSPTRQEKLGSLIAASGVIWAAYHATIDSTYVVHSLDQVMMQPGPLEVCAVGILIWLWAKFRYAIHSDR